MFDNPASPFVLGVYGEDVFGEVINNIIGNRKSDGRKWVVKYYSRPEQINKCHILFVSQLKPSALMKLLKHLDNKPILTVGDNIPEFCQQGGVVNFTPKDASKRFEINNISANDKNLSISSKLLMLSKIITYDEVKF